MPLGPVFNAELLTTARRARYYVVRFLYGLIILFQIYTTYEGNSYRLNANGGQPRLKDMADFALTLFITFAIVQAVVVLLLTPALVGGTIADERQRKTLHYLLTSRLSSAEIVLGKLGARLLQVLILVALGLPVVCLIGLFGGVDFQVLFFSYAGTFTTIFFVASASILVSVGSRKPREAIMVLYIFEMIWLIGPPLVMNLMPNSPAPWPEIARWVNPFLQYVALTSPFYLTMPMGGMRGGATGLMETALWAMGLQVAYGIVFVVIASWRLRPASRNDGAGPRGVGKWWADLARRRRWFPRPDCGDDAMLWKEMHVARTGGVTKAALVLLGLLTVGIMGYIGFDLFVAAADEVWRNSYFSASGRARDDFNVFLRTSLTFLYVLWFLGVASSAASGLSSEREEDHWLALISTPLSGLEIIRAKMIGPVWGLRLVAYLMFLLMALGVGVGSIHPLALVATLVELVVFTWFLTALGTFFSLRAKNSTRSLASTIGLLIFLNGGYMFCCIPLRPNTPAIMVFSTPAIFAFSLFSVHDLNQMGNYNQYNRTGETIVACIVGVITYGVAAAGLTSSLLTMFDGVVDRPDRFRQKRTPHQEAEFRKAKSKEIVYRDEV